jgi:hypothetical protein
LKGFNQPNMSLFDSLQNTVFDLTATTFGYPATWKPSDSEEILNAIVLYKDATEKHGLSDQDYNIERYQMEYKNGDFEGLKEKIAAGDLENVKIELKPGVIGTFAVRRIETKYDGKTIVAFLNEPVI